VYSIWSTGESGTSSSHQCPERAAFILSFRFRLFTLSFSFFDIVPCGEHGVGASSIADPSESPFFSSPSSSLGVSARFVPTVLPLGTAQRGEGRAEGGCPEEDPEWEGRGGGEGETVATAMEGSTNACVDTAEGGCEEEGEGGGGVAALEGREAVGKPARGRWVIWGCISIVTMRSKRESHSGVRVRGHPLSLRGAYPQRGAQPLGKFGHCANVCVREKDDGQSQTRQDKDK